MILKFKNYFPKISPSAYIAEGTFIIGEVEIGDFSSIWFGAVLRGDGGKIFVGSSSSVQDHSILHEGVIVGDKVTVGHRAILHSCQIENGALIGAGAVVWDDCKIGEEAIIGVGAVLPRGLIVPSRTLVLGVPAKIIRELKEVEINTNRIAALYYRELAEVYKKGV